MPESAPAPRRARVLQRLLLVLLSPVVFLALTELALRATGISTDLARNKNFKVGVPIWLLAEPEWVRIEQRRIDTRGPIRAEDVAWFGYFEEARYVGIRLKPHLDVRVVNPFNEIEVAKGATFRITSNASGFRGPEFTPKKPDVLRVAAVGDSSTFGWGVDPEFTYEELLARRLTTSRWPAEVFNLGMPGTTSRHGLGVFAHYAAELKPDVVIVSFGANDARVAPVSAAEGLAIDDTWLGAARWTMVKLRTYQLARRMIFSVYDPFDDARKPGAGPRRPMVKAVAPDAYVANLRTLRDQASALGARTVFLSICTPDDYVAAMQQTAEQLHIPFVDAGRLFYTSIDRVKAGLLYPDELQYYKELYGTDALEHFWRYYVTTDGCHPNRVGQSLIADAVADAVRATFGR